MIVGSCVNLSACSRLSVGLKDIVEILTGDVATQGRLRVDFFEYLRVPVETDLYQKSNFKWEIESQEEIVPKLACVAVLFCKKWSQIVTAVASFINGNPGNCSSGCEQWNENSRNKTRTQDYQRKMVQVKERKS